MLHIETDLGADAVYIQLIDEPIGFTQELDDGRIVDYALNSGKPVGIDLLEVSNGVKLNDLPEIDKVRKILEGLDIAVYTE